MSYARQLLDSYPRAATVDAGALASTIEALSDCAEACTADADADLSEHELRDLVKCIRLCEDCADVCTAARNIISRQTDYDSGVTSPLMEACIRVCKSCSDECEQHAQRHAHCRVCLEACRRCEQACRELLAFTKQDNDQYRPFVA
jgi:Domain of Unknown Function (DUF326)